MHLKAYIKKLAGENDLKVITAPVDPYLELAEIHRRVIAEEGPALLFTNVKGKDFPVVTNLFGTKKRIELAFGAKPETFIRDLVRLAEDLVPPSWAKLWKHRRTLLKSAGIGVSRSSSLEPFRHEIPGADLTKLPAITSWIEDGGPFLTLPLVHTKGKKSENLGIYRMQIFSGKESGMHFQIGKGGGFHLFEAERENRPMSVNVYLGGPPAFLLSAIAPLPENIPEFLLASLIQEKKLRRGTRHPLNAPFLDFEFCLQGHVPPHVRRPEGPFGDHYGYDSLVHDYPVFRVERIYHAKNAVFPATVVGKPRQEDYYLGNYLQELLSPLFPLVMPQVTGLWSYGETGFHSLSAAIIKERYEREAMSAAFRILGEGQLSLTKFLLVLDKELDLRNFKDVLSHILERVDWRKDLHIISELSMDSLDYTGPEINHGSKGILLGLGDAVRQLPESFTSSELPNMIRNVKVFCPGCLVIEVPGYKEEKDCVASIASLSAFSNWPLIVCVDHCEDTTKNESSFLWTVFTRFEPAADIYARDVKIIRKHLSYTGPIVIDARMKPWYPKELLCDEATGRLVDRRWQEYFSKNYSIKDN